MLNKRENNKKYKVLFYLLGLIVIIIAGWGIINYTNVHKSASTPNNKSNNKTSIRKKTPISSPNNSTKKSANTNSGQKVVGGVISTSGQNSSNSSTASTNSATSSSSGLITLIQPSSNSTISNGAIIYGTSKLSEVGYTLIDNRVGIISQGSLSVINGVFSGRMLFTPQSTTGRLDVYSTNAQGVQSNEIEINVNFN